MRKCLQMGTTLDRVPLSLIVHWCQLEQREKWHGPLQLLFVKFDYYYWPIFAIKTAPWQTNL